VRERLEEQGEGKEEIGIERCGMRIRRKMSAIKE
jgi:hypothetical protein